MTYSIGFLAVGALMVIAAAWRLYAGRDCVFQSETLVPGKTDRNSILVSAALLVFGAMVFIAGGLHAWWR